MLRDLVRACFASFGAVLTVPRISDSVSEVGGSGDFARSRISAILSVREREVESVPVLQSKQLFQWDSYSPLL